MSLLEFNAHLNPNAPISFINLVGNYVYSPLLLHTFPIELKTMIPQSNNETGSSGSLLPCDREHLASGGNMAGPYIEGTVRFSSPVVLDMPVCEGAVLEAYLPMPLAKRTKYAEGVIKFTPAGSGHAFKYFMGKLFVQEVGS
jgi:hypothetical protein